MLLCAQSASRQQLHTGDGDSAAAPDMFRCVCLGIGVLECHFRHDFYSREIESGSTSSVGAGTGAGVGAGSMSAVGSLFSPACFQQCRTTSDKGMCEKH